MKNIFNQYLSSLHREDEVLHMNNNNAKNSKLHTDDDCHYGELL
jgi:hypothetical protein